MKHLFRKGLLFGMGWYLGRNIIFGIRETVIIMFTKYIPRKYWDTDCPEQPWNKNFTEANKEPDVKHPIGFRKD